MTRTETPATADMPCAHTRQNGETAMCEKVINTTGPQGRGLYEHTCDNTTWCAEAGGIGGGCGGETTYTSEADVTPDIPLDTMCLARGRVFVDGADVGPLCYREDGHTGAHVYSDDAGRMLAVWA